MMQTYKGHFIRNGAISAMLLAGFFLISSARGQTGSGGRYLLIFDTSSAMKKCLPAEKTALDRLFMLGMREQLQPGDTIGVWTFGSKPGIGQFPLLDWNPEAAANITSNIFSFVEHQHYSKATRFDRVMPMVTGIINSSDRLTVLIFCDGDGKMKGTPCDDEINAVFQKNQRAMHQTRQPFLVILRTQSGRYVGCTVNAATATINFPAFPPLPTPPAPVMTNLPPPAPPVPTAPPLIIIGTTVSTNLPPPAAPKFQATNPPEKFSNQTNTPAVPPIHSVGRTNTVAPPSTNVITSPSTNTVASSPKNPPPGSNKGLLAIGAIMLAAAGALTLLLLRRLRARDSASLITRSMKRD